VATIWQGKVPTFEKLSGDVTFDVCVIGGGIAGLWCAYRLVKEGKRVVVLEANKIASGTTMGSTAILTYAHDDIYHRIRKKHDISVASKYFSDAKMAIKEIVELVWKEKWEIDLEPIDYILFSKKWKGKCHLEKELKTYDDLRHGVVRTKANLPYRTKFAIKCSGSYQFNPVKLSICLANAIIKAGGKIFCGTMVKEAPDGEVLKVGEYSVSAKHFVVATHFPYINLPGFYWLKMYQEQNYCIAIKGSNPDFCKGQSFESIDQKGFEYRRVGENILIDGASFRTGEKPKKSKYQIVERHIRRYFKDSNVTVRYCAQDCMTLDLLPYAGRYSHFADNVFVVSGFNKWGMTSSYIAAGVIVDMIKGELSVDAPFSANIYSPQRNVLLANIIETIENVGVIAASFAGNLVNGNPKCPHMGCNLKWNRDEQTWDCPCHGSRFSKCGKIINNPSTEPLEIIST